MMSYFPAALVSVIAHGLLILLVFMGWSYTEPLEPPKPPAYIKATLLDLKTQGKEAAPKPKPKPKPKSKPPEPKVDKAEIEKQRLQEKLFEQKAQQKAKQKQIALEKAKKEKADKLKKEKAKKLAEKRQKEKKEKKQREERQRADQQKFNDELAKERERLQAESKADELAQQAEDDQKLSKSYEDLIKERVQQNWSRPPSARKDMEAYVTIKMVPTGEIVDAFIKKSSGNGAYDRSAIQAVKKTRQIPELKELPNRVFEQRFRQLTLTFTPQDLRQ